MNRKILVLAPFRKSHIEKIKQILPDDFSLVHIAKEISEEKLKKELCDAEIVVGQPPVSLLAETEKNCPNLRMIQMLFAGTDMYTRGEAEFPKDKIMLANGSGVYGMIMSQFVVGMILSLMLNFKEYYSQQENRIWERRGPILSLDKAKVLIFGAGDIGSQIAKRLSGFDAYCMGVCRNTDREREGFHKLCSLDEAEAYIPKADVIIGCIPNTIQTEGYMDYRRLSLMKKNSVIVNVGRGNFIDCMALDEILRSGKIWGAGLDVTNPEPLPENHPLWANKRCMITPHTSGTTFGQLEETEELLCDLVCDNLSRYISGKEIRNRIFKNSKNR